MAELYCLRVKRGVAGSTFPFDRIYLVRHGEHACLQTLFRYALVMPVEGDLKRMLIEHARPEQYQIRAYDRDDENEMSSPHSESEWASFINDNSWVMAVPILTRYVKKAMPRYLAAAGWYQKKRYRKGGKGASGIQKFDRKEHTPGLTYLQTPEKNIRPVCVMCPQFIKHQNGECHLGQPICYENLALGITDYFSEGLAAKDPSINVNEPEIEGFAHADVQE